ncbi:MAG: hypothetical protein WDZ91_09240 [Paenibacillaceae bacterium]
MLYCCLAQWLRPFTDFTIGWSIFDQPTPTLDDPKFPFAKNSTGSGYVLTSIAN